MNLRKLLKTEVQIVIDVEQEDMVPIEGNVQSSEDPESDRESEEWVRKQLDSGNDLAWCQVTVRASWKGFVGQDHLGAVSCANQEDLDALIEAHAMEANALAALNKSVAEHFATLLELAS